MKFRGRKRHAVSRESDLRTRRVTIYPFTAETVFASSPYFCLYAIVARFILPATLRYVTYKTDVY